MRIFHKKWRKKLDSYAMDEWKQERQPSKVNPFTLRRGQVPLEFFKKPRNTQEKLKYIKKYGKFLPREKAERMQSINPLDNIYDETLFREYVQHPGNSLNELKGYESYIESNIGKIKRANIRKEMKELLMWVRGEIDNRERFGKYVRTEETDNERNDAW